MARTNFAQLTDEELTMWNRDFWATARNAMFINQYMGTGSNSVIQRITDLNSSDKGARAVITLVADLVSDGVTGDNTLEGNEEALQSFEQVIQIDQLRNAVRNEGALAEQRSVVRFREEARDRLAYWIADRTDQLAFLTLSGISYNYRNKGNLRPPGDGLGKRFADLTFADDVRAPSAGRHVRWDSSTGLETGSTAAVASTDKLSYKCIVRLKEYAVNNYVKGIRMSGGEEMYYLFVTPTQMADLRLDPDFLANVRSAGVRGDRNPLFTGQERVILDGTMIVPFRHVYDTTAAPSGSKWGSGGTVDGARALFCGSQAMAFVDITGAPRWVEETFDYKNQPGISVGKMMGMLKPRYRSAPFYTSDEDFGIVACDTAV